MPYSCHKSRVALHFTRVTNTLILPQTPCSTRATQTDFVELLAALDEDLRLSK